MATSEDPEEQDWINKQFELKKELITEDDIDWNKDGNPFGSLHLVGGVDISFQKGDNDHACPCLVVLSYPDLKIVYEDFSFEHLKVQYKSQFLAFREVPLLKDKIDKLKREKPELMPQVIMVDGNGIHHQRGFGIACHLGVLTNLPTIGIAKNLLQIDGIANDEEHSKQIQDNLKKKGDKFSLIGKSGAPTGMAFRSSTPCGLSTCKPIYVSVGHRVGLETAVELVQSCCNHRIPEPTRQADIFSRKYLRENYEEQLSKCLCKNNSKV